MATLREIPEPLPVAPQQTRESQQFIAAHAENSHAASALRDVAIQLREVATDSRTYTSVLERHRDAEQEHLQAPAQPVHVMEETRTQVLDAFGRLEETYGRLNEAVKKASQDPGLSGQVSGIAGQLAVAQQQMTADRQALDARSRAPEEELARAARQTESQALTPAELQALSQAKKEAAQKREALRSQPIKFIRQAPAWEAPDGWDVKRSPSPVGPGGAAVEPDTRLSLGTRLMRTLKKFGSQQNLRPAAPAAEAPPVPTARASTFPETVAPRATLPSDRQNQSVPNLVLQTSSAVASTDTTQPRTPQKRAAGRGRPTPIYLKGTAADKLREAADIPSKIELAALKNSPGRVQASREAELPPVPAVPSPGELEKLEAARVARVEGPAHPRRAAVPVGPQTTQPTPSPTPTPTHTVRR